MTTPKPTEITPGAQASISLAIFPEEEITKLATFDEKDPPPGRPAVTTVHSRLDGVRNQAIRATSN